MSHIGVWRTKRARTRAAAGALFFAGLALRVWGAGWGLPFIWHPDTHQYVAAAWVMRPGEMNPLRFIPYLANLPLYVYLVYALKEAIHAGYALFGSREAFHAFIDSGGLVLATRLMSAGFGALSVLVVYRLAAVSFGRFVGAAAAALLSVNYFNVRNAHSAMPDVAMMFFFLLAAERSATYLRGGGRKQLLLASAAAAAAAAIKITGAAALVCPFVAVLARERFVDWRSAVPLALRIALVFGATLLLLCPQLVTNGRFLADIFEETFYHGGHRDSPQEPVPVWLLHHRYYAWGLGWGAYALAALGAVVMTFRQLKWAAALLAAPAVYLAVHLTRRMCYPRYVLPVTPFLLLAAAWAARRLAGKVSARRPAFVASCVVALVCLDPFARSLRFDWLCCREDTRYLAQRWLREHTPVYAVILFEGLMPPMPSRPYAVYARGHTQPFILFVRPDYFVSSMTVRRFLAFNPMFGEPVQRWYAKLDARFPVVAEFKPFEGNRELPYTETISSLWRRTRRGPHIKIYKIKPPTPRRVDLPVMLKPPLRRADWLYLARINCFPIGILTRGLQDESKAAEIAFAELKRLKVLP